MQASYWQDHAENQAEHLPLNSTNILSLSNELLINIWRYLSRKHVENVALVNRRLHLVGRDFVDRHRYRRVQNQPDHFEDQPTRQNPFEPPQSLPGRHYHGLSRVSQNDYANVANYFSRTASWLITDKDDLPCGKEPNYDVIHRRNRHQ